MKNYLEVLSKCPLFKGIDKEELAGMLSCLNAKVEHFDKKFTVFTEGAPAKHIGIMLSGTAQIFKVDYYGNKSILSTVGPSEVFAEAFACAEVEALPVTVIANEPCEVMLIDSARIIHTCSNNCGFHRQLIFNLMKDLATKTLAFHQKIDVTSKRTTREKLMTYLMHTAKKARSDSFEIPFNRQELADYLEVDRSGLSAEISKLRNEGIIESNKNRFKLL